MWSMSMSMIHHASHSSLTGKGQRCNPGNTRLAKALKTTRDQLTGQGGPLILVLA